MTTILHATLEKGTRDREAEERVASRVALAALCGVLETEVDVSLVEEPLESLLLALLGGHISWVDCAPGRRPTIDQPLEGGLLCGSFDPLHEGHVGLREVAEEITGAPVRFELSLVNADKGRLRVTDALERGYSLLNKYPLVITRAALFDEKALCFPGMTFVVGVDTAERVLDPAYYPAGGRDDTLAAIRGAGCRFLVAGRAERGTWKAAEALRVPEGLADLFHPIPESRFRVDLSSTELRQDG